MPRRPFLDMQEVSLAKAGLTYESARDLPIGELIMRIDRYRKSVGLVTTKEAGYFRAPSPECHEAVGMPRLVSHAEVEKMLDEALKA